MNSIEKIDMLKQLYEKLLSLIEYGKNDDSYFIIKTRINDVIAYINDVNITTQNADAILKEIKEVDDDFYPPRGGLSEFSIWYRDSDGKYIFNDKLNQELDDIKDKIWNILKDY
jgi:hypothetical protein